MSRYIVITPAKDEAEYIEYTLRSIINQTVLPARWIIVNDGSADNTAEIVEKYIEKAGWIRLVNNETSHEQRMGGSKVVRAFDMGYDLVKNEDYDFIVKLDADLTLPENYFEEVMEEFHADPELGLCGGYCVVEKGNGTVREKCADYHIRGAFKTYRKQCFEEIGGFKPIWAWDGIDEMEAMYKGWKTKNIELAVLHHRPTTAAYNPYAHAVKCGIESYKGGSDLGLTLVRMIKQMLQKPFVLGGLMFFTGFVKAWFKKEPKHVEPDFGKFIRRFHYKRLRNGLLGI